MKTERQIVFDRDEAADLANKSAAILCHEVTLAGGKVWDRDRNSLCDLLFWFLRACVTTVDPRDPDHTRTGIFVYHNCHRCKDGADLSRCPTPNAPGNCGEPVARND